jgi:hypothetical protein
MSSFFGLFKSKNKVEKVVSNCSLFANSFELVSPTDIERLKVLIEGKDRSITAAKARQTFFDSIS